jgi:hypothetical protein
MALLCALIPICQPMPDASRLQKTRGQKRPCPPARTLRQDARTVPGLISDLCPLNCCLGLVVMARGPHPTPFRTRP